MRATGKGFLRGLYRQSRSGDEILGLFVAAGGDYKLPPDLTDDNPSQPLATYGNRSGARP
jgi:hypothetical protein